MNSKAMAFAALTIAMMSCGKRTTEPTAGPATGAEPVIHQFLEGVPADTPYLAAAIDPAPLVQILPWLATLDDAVMPTPERVEELLADPDLKPRKRRMLALLAELSGHYSGEGLLELGFETAPRFALYGIGVLPALRLEIEDAKAVGEFLARVDARSGVAGVVNRSGAQEYRTYRIRDNRLLVVAISGNRLLAGVTTPGAEDTFVAHLLGVATPADSLDEADVRKLARTWDLRNFGIGFVDLARVSQFFLAPKPGLDTEIADSLRTRERVISDVCRHETAQLTETIPRIVFGSESWSPTSLSFGGGVEVRSDFAPLLAGTKTGAPLTESAHAEHAAGIAGFAFDVRKVVDVVRTRAASIADKPFQCEWYGGINRGASAIASRWTMVPPALATVTGGTLLVKDLRPTADFAEDRRQSNLDVDAVAAITAEAPVEVFDFVKLFNAETDQLTLDPSGRPLALPASQSLAKLQSPQIAAYPNALVLTSGEWEPLSDQELLQRPAPFFFLRYDAEKIAEQLQLGEDSKAWRHALRGKASIELDPTARGLRLRTTYSRETSE